MINQTLPCLFVVVFCHIIVEGGNRGKANEADRWTTHLTYEQGGVNDADPISGDGAGPLKLQY